MSNLKIGFRVDASSAVGTGHVVRCTALAQELIARGAEVRFFCQELPGNLNDWLETTERIPVSRLLNNAAETMSKALQAWQSECEQPEEDITWLVVDHYGLDAEWEKAIRTSTRKNKIFVIDDLANRPHDCDLLLDQNYYPDPEKRYQGLLPESSQLLLGPRYALLRKHFLTVAEQRTRNKIASGKIACGTSGKCRVLVFFGGSDPGDFTSQAIRLFQDSPELKEIDCSFDVVVGASNAQKEQVEALCQIDKRFFYHCQTPDMPNLMSDADLFVGAGGSTTWERLGFGLPSVVVAVADNQVELSEALAEQGIQQYLGRLDRLKPDPFLTSILALLQNDALRQQMRACAEHWAGSLGVDFRGAERVASRLLPNVIEFRPVTINDSERMFTWRNHPKTRQFIFQPEPIAYETHCQWVKQALVSENRVLLMGYSKTTKDFQGVGILRFDLNKADNSALVSIYLNPDLPSGLGYGTQLLIQGAQWLGSHYPWVKHIRAEILPDNMASIRAFQKAGYRTISSERFETMAFVM